MGVPDRNLPALGPWVKGVDNLTPEQDVGNDALRAAVNVDVHASGKVSLRSGFLLADAVPGLHSLFADDRFPLMVGSDDAVLHAWDANLHRRALTALTPGEVDYAVAAGTLYWSNGTTCGAVASDGTSRPWAVETPNPPHVTAESAGGLAAGTYQVALTFVDARGREGGASPAIEVDVPANGGIGLSALPLANDPDVALLRVYVTHANGEVLFLARELPVGMPQASIGVHPEGRACQTQYLMPMPAGRCLAIFAGRLFAVHGRSLHYSEALDYGLTRRAHNWLTFDSPPVMVAPLGEGPESGLYVATATRTYFLAGPDPAAWQRAVAHADGAVPGVLQVSAKTLRLDEVRGLVPVWMSRSGQLCAGLPAGQVLELHASTYEALVDAEAASLAVREFDGLRQILVTLRGGTASAARATDHLEAEVWKDGVRIS